MGKKEKKAKKIAIVGGKTTERVVDIEVKKDKKKKKKKESAEHRTQRGDDVFTTASTPQNTSTPPEKTQTISIDDRMSPAPTQAKPTIPQPIERSPQQAQESSIKHTTSSDFRTKQLPQTNQQQPKNDCPNCPGGT